MHSVCIIIFCEWSWMLCELFVEGSFRFLGGESQPWPQVYTGQIIQAWKDQEKEGKLRRRSHRYQCVFHQIRQRVENNKTSCWISYCTYRALYLLLMIFHLHKIFLSWIYVAVLIFWHYHNGLMPLCHCCNKSPQNMVCWKY